MKGKKKLILLIVIILVAIIIIGIVINSNKNSSNNQTSISYITNNTTENEEPELQATTVNIGDTVSVDNCITMTLSDVEVVDNYEFTYTETSGHFTSNKNAGITPSSGMKVVCLKGIMTNLTSNEVYPTNHFVMAKIIVNDNVYSTTLKLFDTEKAESYSKIVAQQSLEYFLYAEVPENVADNIETCTINFGFNNELSVIQVYTGVEELDYQYTLNCK